MMLNTFTVGIVISLAVHVAILMLPHVSDNNHKTEAGHVEIGLVHLAPAAPLSSSPPPALPPKTITQAEAKNPNITSRPIKNNDQQTPPKLTPKKPIKQITTPKQTVKTPHQQAATLVNATDRHQQTVKLNPLQQSVDTRANHLVSAPPTPHPLNSIPTGSPKIPSSTKDFANASSSFMPQHEKEAHSPRYHINPPPDYPSLALKRRWQGEVWLRVLVGEQGEVIEAWVENSSGHSLLDESALKTVRNWKFFPGHDGKRNVSEEVHLPIRFELEQS